MNLFDHNQAIAEPPEQIFVTCCSVKSLALTPGVGGEVIEDPFQAFKSFARENDLELLRTDVSFRWHSKMTGDSLVPLARKE